ncbi:MAG: hypothetical protein R3E87_08085 [Burkholderiaceae bacterium]
MTPARWPAMLALVAASASAQDPIATDGDKYRVLLENEQVRVLAYEDQPGARTQWHTHPGFVVVALAPFERRLTLDDGRRLTRRFDTGEVLFSKGETHLGENIGTTPTRVIMIELKRAPVTTASGR